MTSDEFEEFVNMDESALIAGNGSDSDSEPEPLPLTLTQKNGDG